MERRRVDRRCPAADEPLSRARLRTGRELTVIDVSDFGALVEGGRLLPGTHLDMHLVTNNGRVLVRGRVVRAFVAALSGDSVLYRSALEFEQAVNTNRSARSRPADATRIARHHVLESDPRCASWDGPLPS